MEGFYTEKELEKLGIKHFGKNALVSTDVRIFHPEKFSIGNNSRLDAFCIVTGEVEIGDHVHIAPFCILSGPQGIKISDFVGIAARTSLYTNDADYDEGSMTNPTIPAEFRGQTKGSIVLDKHVLIGAQSVILPNSFLGKGSTYGAFSLISGKYDGWFVYAGIPVKKLKQRPKEEIQKNEQKVYEIDRKNGIIK